MPTPARAATASRATSSPSSAKAAVAAASRRSRLRRASARSGRGVVEEAAAVIVAKTEAAPFILVSRKRRNLRFESVPPAETERKDLPPHDRHPASLQAGRQRQASGRLGALAHPHRPPQPVAPPRGRRRARRDAARGQPRAD